MADQHNLDVDAMMCVSCGIATKMYQFRHQNKCFPPINQHFKHECEFCSAKFYFCKDESNPFYVTHINHKHKVETEWNACAYCGLKVPDVIRHVQKNCLFKLVQIQEDDAKPPPQKKAKHQDDSRGY